LAISFKKSTDMFVIGYIAQHFKNMNTNRCRSQEFKHQISFSHML